RATIMALHPCGCFSECEGSRQGSLHIPVCANRLRFYAAAVVNDASRELVHGIPFRAAFRLHTTVSFDQITSEKISLELNPRCCLCPLWVNNGHFAKSRRCPLYPQKRTLGLSREMSALCQKQTYAVQQIWSLLHHLVSEGEKRPILRTVDILIL